MAQLETATLAGGCFWCLEAVYLRMEGVVSAQSGYMGGHAENPTYKDVCTGITGHAEVVQVVFDTGLISFRDLLEVFFAIHDPTTLNRQGHDVGPQYRSAIFYHSDEQRRIAEEVMAGVPGEVVTQVTAASTFYPAEAYHQQYFDNNPYQPYCMFVVSPKVEKFVQKFAGKLKPEAR